VPYTPGKEVNSRRRRDWTQRLIRLVVIDILLIIKPFRRTKKPNWAPKGKSLGLEW